ncbi:MAG: AEC family transporter [Desulfuromonadales bacterium]
MSLFLNIITIVLPVFMVIGLGYLLRRIRLVNEEFLFQTNRLVYFVALPLLLFYKIGSADFFANFNGALVVGSAAAVALGFALSYGYAALRGYPPAARRHSLELFRPSAAGRPRAQPQDSHRHDPAPGPAGHRRFLLRGKA